MFAQLIPPKLLFYSQLFIFWLNIVYPVPISTFELQGKLDKKIIC